LTQPDRLSLDGITGKSVKSVSERRRGREEEGFTGQQIIGFLKEAESDMPVKSLCGKHGFSDAVFYGWCLKCGGDAGS
jgi:transposase